MLEAALFIFSFNILPGQSFAYTRRETKQKNKPRKAELIQTSRVGERKTERKSSSAPSQKRQVGEKTRHSLFPERLAENGFKSFTQLLLDHGQGCQSLFVATELESTCDGDGLLAHWTLIGLEVRRQRRSCYASQVCVFSWLCQCLIFYRNEKVMFFFGYQATKPKSWSTLMDCVLNIVSIVLRRLLVSAAVDCLSLN